MPDSPPPSRSRIPEEEARSSRPLRLVDERAREVREASHPPSEPRPLPGRPGADAGPDRPARVQLIAVLLLLLVLVVVPLYLWRRPRAVSEEADAATAAGSAAITAATTTTNEGDAGPRIKDGVTLADTRVLACHDPGPKKTDAPACDRLPGFEGAFARAILDSASCVPPGTSAANITYVAKVHLGRHRSQLHLTYAHDGTSMATKVASTCAMDVKKALANVAFDQAHAHTTYEIEIAATYKR